MTFAAPEGTELASVIGAGTVFEVAVVKEGDRALVAKRLAPRVREEPEARAAMVREAKLLSIARHPSLPSIVRVGADAHGPFVLETRAEGVSLRDLVQAWRMRGQRVPSSLLVHVASSAAEALADVHELADAAGSLGVVHGDLGPDHVLLGPIGQIRFVDFGAARFRGDGGATLNRGTLPFAAPEVARGDAESTAATDVYALAATILSVAIDRPLTQQRADAAMLLEIGEKGIDPALVDLTPFSREAKGALRRALEVHPRDRLSSARDLARALSP